MHSKSNVTAPIMPPMFMWEAYLFIIIFSIFKNVKSVKSYMEGGKCVRGLAEFSSTQKLCSLGLLQKAKNPNFEGTFTGPEGNANIFFGIRGF